MKDNPLKILVLVKQVPDTWGDRKLDLGTGQLQRSASESVIDEINERALEVALEYKDAHEAEVVAVTMGPKEGTDVLRKSLAMGADSALHVVDDSLAGSDVRATSAVLSAAIRQAGFDLVVAGNESTDGRGGVIPAMIAEYLGVPHLTNLDSVSIVEASVSGERVSEYGTASLVATLPAVISVTERSADPRFASFGGIMRAKKKPLITIDLADLGIEMPSARSNIISVTERPARAAGITVIDEGHAGEELAEFLIAQRLI